MTISGAIVEVAILADRRTRFDAVVGDVAGNQMEIMCFQEMNAHVPISMECEDGFAVGYVVAVANESDGLISYQVKIQEIVSQRAERIHMSWGLFGE